MGMTVESVMVATDHRSLIGEPPMLDQEAWDRGTGASRRRVLSSEERPCGVRPDASRWKGVS